MCVYYLYRIHKYSLLSFYLLPVCLRFQGVLENQLVCSPHREDHSSCSQHLFLSCPIVLCVGLRPCAFTHCTAPMLACLLVLLSLFRSHLDSNVDKTLCRRHNLTANPCSDFHSLSSPGVPEPQQLSNWT